MKIRNFLVAVTLAGASTSAIAEDNNRFYAGSGAGLYYVDFDDLDFDESAPTLRVFGGYEFNQHLSVELGFTNLFESSDSVLGADIDIDGTAWDLRVQPTLPINDQFSAFGIVGWTQYEFDVSVSLGPVSASDDDTESDLMYGLGAAWNLNDSWDLRGEWIALDVDDADFGMFSVSATYNFK